MAPHEVSTSYNWDGQQRMSLSPLDTPRSSEGSYVQGAGDAIAIVGLACRLPGDVSSGSKMWDLLVNGRSGQCDIPSSRFNVDAFYHPKGVDRPGSMNTKGGYFLKEDVRAFENDFFGINNMEATYMDPQQRKLLEVVFECFESAGVPLEKVSGSNTGCYVGNFTVDFQVMQTRDSEYLHRYSATGMGTTILGNRISHAFNLQGPSMVLDTACSSSLYCLHVACSALENGECDGAVVAGANLIQSPEQHLGTMKAGVLSGTSTCHTFDSSADGYGRADGIGALYLKRLSDAIRDGDPIRSVIRGTAINANGKTPGITLPSAIGQEAVIRKAYQKAGLDVNETAYVECHGTGTPVGDPIEVEALSRVFKRDSQSPLLIGSIKTNLGHSEAASGISSIIKATLALEHSYIPATIGIKRINPKIKTAEWNIGVVTELRAWPTKKSARSGHSQVGLTRRAGVNSFGYGGANAHAILENADVHVPSSYGRAGRTAEILGSRKSFLLPFSATTKESLTARVTDLADLNLEDVSIVDLAYTLALRRSHFNKRGFVIARKNSLKHSLNIESLRTLAKDAVNSPSQYAFVFTGQGAQWPKMGEELFDEFPVFRNSVSEMDSVLQSLPHPPSWSLRDAIREPESTSKINQVTHSQPICTALQIALVQLLASWDISPSAVLGHSSGEMAAAFAAGYLSSAEAITAAYYRGYVVGKNSQDGAMMAAGMSKAAADSEIQAAGFSEKIRVACVNSPESVTISGDASAIDSLLETLQTQKLFARKLKTGGRAYHSHHMWALGEEYQTLLEQAFLTLDPSSKLPTGAIFVSSVTGELCTSDPGPAYWRSNLENPVLFHNAVDRLTKEGDFHLIELGPHSALELPIKQIRSTLGISEDRLPYSTAITRGKDSVETVLGLAGRLYLHGNTVSLGKVNNLKAKGKSGCETYNYKVIHDLPSYRWNYDGILWNECRASLEFRHRRYQRHELLGSKVPGGNGLESTWRNILRVDDIPWLRDHKLEETVVFPGAGYMAMAVEAVTQASSFTLEDKKTVRFQNVNILAALALSTEATAQIELFTTLRPTSITYTSKSENSWEFDIVSFTGDTSTTHATGSVSITSPSSSTQLHYQAAKGALEPSATRIWYEKLIKEGLNFGPQFQSINEVYIPRMKSIRHCTTKVPLLQHSDPAENSSPVYAVHPITIDAMLQTAIIATTAGNTRDLRAKVPTRIGSAIIEVPEVCPHDSWSINAQASVIGFGAAEINAELYNQKSQVTVRLENVRLAPYEAAAQIEVAQKRHPMLRVLWKPDIHGLGLMPSDDFTRYLDGFVAESQSEIADEGLLKLGASLNLISHRNPGLRILELGNDISEITQAAIALLLADTDFKRLQSYTTGYISEEGELFGAVVDLATGKQKDTGSLSLLNAHEVDLILLPNVSQSDQYLKTQLANIRDLLAPGGMLLALSGLTGQVFPAGTGLDAIHSDMSSGNGSIILAHSSEENQVDAGIRKKSIVIVDQGFNVLSKALYKQIPEAVGQTASRVSFADVTKDTVPPGSLVVSLLESEKPLLAVTTDSEMSRIKTITDNASTIVWVTAGDLLSSKCPDYALVSGLSRALMLEQPSLRFFTIDVDDIHRNASRTADNIISIVKQSDGSLLDFEFIERNGVPHISRFVPDDDLNNAFRQKQGAETMTTTLDSAKPAQLSIGTPGQFDSLYFKQIQLPKDLEPSDVQVEVKAVGLNAKDFYALGGKVDTKDASCTLEYCGVVERVGSNVTSLVPGDRVVVMAPSYFKTSEIIPDWACMKLRDDEDFDTLSTLPVVYATALYALHTRAQIQSGETILIHSGAGGVGIAAIQVAQMAGAEIFTTVSTEAKRNYLIKTFGINPSNIFDSRDTSFLTGILETTNGKGVDVVLNSLTGELLHASWKCCASFGRFVEIGKRDLTDAGKLEMEQFLKNATFTAFDMSNLYYHENPAYHKIWAKLLAEVVDLYRQKKIAKIEPLEVFDVSDMTNALRYFSSRNRMGKVAINLENPASELKYQPFKYKTTFNPDKSYIMIGCLGGLGRSMSKWMVSRGARKFVFLGRSGIDKAPARRLVEDLESNGAECKVVRGDVCSEASVQEVVAQVDGLIGGVIQAAMGLNEALFTTMPNTYWHTGIDPKVQGSWNLHKAIKDKGKDAELDFFLMTSSISGSVGTATESNYCSANYFLDMFARYRQSQGLPAMSVGLGMISEVGYLHENPEIEALLLRKGIQAINEDELLQIIDITLSNKLSIPHAYDSYASAHVLTGLEPFGLMELRKKGFEGTNPTLNDPRASILARALDGQGDLALKNQDGNLPAEIVKALEDGTPLSSAVPAHISKRFGDLVLIPMEKVDVAKPLAAYGMDSMIAAEFRTWFFQAFKVDVPFLELLSKSVTIASLSERVLAEVEKSE